MQNNVSSIAAPLVEWFRQNKRELPWRQDKDPYHVWVSEIMLQQTRIEAVTERYYAFMQALPRVEDLAAVSEARLLKLWEGLGYYSRARNLKKAAGIICDTYGGKFPETYAQLVKLPGIGAYTAGAIASICFNQAVPAVDGNVLRVLARVCADESNVLLPETKQRAEALIREILPQSAGEFNEGIMELGETVCLPNGLPLCHQCPIRQYCKAYALELTDTLPVRIKNTQRKKVQKTVLIYSTPSEQLAIEKRANKGLLAGLYQLPNTDRFLSEAEITEQTEAQGLEVQHITYLKETKHLFTHIEWQMKVYRVEVAQPGEAYIWCTPQELTQRYALPTAFQKCFPK